MSGAFISKSAPVESGGAYTDWSAYGLEQLWDMVSHENGRATFAQIDAWRRMARLCVDQADALEKAVGQLVARWPSRPGTASEAFASQMARLIQSMREAA